MTLGFFKRLVTPAAEEEFVAGCRDLAAGRRDEAYSHFCAAERFADACFAAGTLALDRADVADAERLLRGALTGEAQLGTMFRKYGIAMTVSLPVTQNVIVMACPDKRGLLLLLAELYQRQGQVNDAMQCVIQLRAAGVDDPAIRLSLAELLVESGKFQEAISLLADIGNDDAVDTACLLYRGRALMALGLNDGAVDEFTRALRRSKDRPADLLLEIRYHRALAYAALGRANSSRKDLQRLFTQDPHFRDVAARLGVAAPGAPAVGLRPVKTHSAEPYDAEDGKRNRRSSLWGIQLPPASKKL